MEENKTVVSAPEEVLSVAKDSLYYACFKCQSFCKECSGLNPLTLGVEGVCDFLQQTRIFLGESYQDVADGTGVSLATVKRTLLKKVEPNLYTVVAINNHFFGGISNQKPCAIPNIVSDPENDVRLNEALRDLERALGQSTKLQGIVDDIHISYKSEMEAFRAEHRAETEAARVEHQKHIDHLNKEIERARADIDRAWENAEHWRHENDRKGKLIDKYMEKIVAG